MNHYCINSMYHTISKCLRDGKRCDKFVLIRLVGTFSMVESAKSDELLWKFALLHALDVDKINAEKPKVFYPHERRQGNNQVNYPLNQLASSLVNHLNFSESGKWEEWSNSEKWHPTTRVLTELLSFHRLSFPLPLNIAIHLKTSPVLLRLPS